MFQSVFTHVMRVCMAGMLVAFTNDQTWIETFKEGWYSAASAYGF